MNFSACYIRRSAGHRSTALYFTVIFHVGTAKKPSVRFLKTRTRDMSVTLRNGKIISTAAGIGLAIFLAGCNASEEQAKPAADTTVTNLDIATSK